MALNYKEKRGGKTIIVTGATSGLGKAIVEALAAYKDEMRVIGVCKESLSHKNVELAEVFNCSLHSLDVTSDANVQDFAGWIGMNPIYALINCAGINFIDWLQEVPEKAFDNVMDTNVKGIWMMVKHLLPALKGGEGTVLNVVSNAAWVPMTHSVAYNASKGAAAIMTQQMARELTKEHDICVFGICPNKLEGTRMSKYIEGRVCELRGWTPDEANRYQRQALLAGFETKVEWVAELVAWLLAKPHRHKYLTGCLLPLGL